MRLLSIRIQFLFLVLGVCAGCSGPLGPSGPYAGLSSYFEAGTPSFDAQVQPDVSGTRRGIRVDLSVPELALIFQRDEETLIARIEWLVRISSQDGRQVLAERSQRQEVRKDLTELPSLFRRADHAAFFELDPGLYRVIVQLEDIISGKQEVKELRFELPSRNRAIVATELLLETRDRRAAIEIVYPDTAAPARAVFHLTGNVARAARLDFALLQLDVDSAAARTPYWQGPGSGFSGINPAEHGIQDTLYSEMRNVRRGALRKIAFEIPPLGSGAYRAVVHIDDLQTEGEDPQTTLSRYFVVRRSSFPRLQMFDELLEPLVYLADANEWRALSDSIYTPGARSAFDTFWGRYMTDRSAAANAVRRYYNRVEESNLRYSDFREGWKTDRGMVYIILGEPLFIERNIDSEIWYYSYGGNRGERAFVFYKIRRSNTPDVIEEYKLNRSFDYDRFWRGEVDRWRRGLDE